MLDENFFSVLEYEICKMLKNSDQKHINTLWCDGVLPSDPMVYSKKYVNDYQTISLKAFMGTDGQTEYELLLKFGPMALSKFARDLSIQECIPKPDEPEGHSIDVKNKKMYIQLY